MNVPQTWRRLQNAQQRERARSHRMVGVVRRSAASVTALDPARSAKVAGLWYVNDETMPGITRLGAPGRFRYRSPDNRAVTDRANLDRIRSLAIPPAWTDVWICPKANGHIQATGRDQRGRKQYRYHPKWREVRDEVKYGRLLAFASALPRIRARVAADLKRTGLPREKVVATVVQLLEKTLIRVGNEEYARQNGSFGLTTMKDGHAKINGTSVRFEFRGKSGIRHSVDLHDRRLARIVKACQELPGYELFQYLDDANKRQVIDSADVNAYLREVSGADFTAKDFRTWAGTVLAAEALVASGEWRTKAESKRKMLAAIDAVAKRLGNTRAVCRKCYIHPAVFEHYLSNHLPNQITEATVARLLVRSIKPNVA